MKTQIEIETGATARQVPRFQPTLPDMRVSRHGAISLLTPLTNAACLWIEANMTLDDWQRLSGSVAIESRWQDEMTLAMRRDGLLIE
ncbi:MAG: hypothetical protein KGJ13_05805 [Patescibacteria group bacterium]|nr:hypothetical protein [Patescibacteria group bacterium]